MKITKKLTNNFTVVTNVVPKNDKMSLEAKGMYLVLLGLPDNWTFSVSGLSRLSNSSKERTSKAIKELEEFGYLKRERFQDNKGFWRANYIITDTPNTENPIAGNPSIGNPDTGKAPLIYNNISNKENNNKELTNIMAAGAAVIVEECSVDDMNKQIGEVIKEFEAVNKNVPNLYKNKTERAAAQFLIITYGYDKVINAIKYAVEVFGKEFAPVITTPYELQQKMAKLVAFKHRDIKDNSSMTISL